MRLSVTVVARQTPHTEECRHKSMKTRDISKQQPGGRGGLSGVASKMTYRPDFMTNKYIFAYPS